jgi:hypothetical protein
MGNVLSEVTTRTFNTEGSLSPYVRDAVLAEAVAL